MRNPRERRDTREKPDTAPRNKVRPGARQNARQVARPGSKPGGGRADAVVRPHAGAAKPRPEPEASGAPAGTVSGPMRIAKAMARAGLCSRRDAERWIAEGRVVVNGKVLASPALDVGPSDRIVVDGKPLPVQEAPKLWRYHKPKGLVTTHKDPEGRPTVFDKLPVEMGRVISIGRLDFNTEGLLLLTNDGALEIGRAHV